MKKVTTSTIRSMKGKEKISVLTAYDYSMAKIFDEAGVDVLLVGDSLGNVILGYDSTIPVTVSDMIHHGKAVVRGTKRAHVVVDMPFMSYQTSQRDALCNAAEIMRQTGASSVKLEGGREIADTVAALTSAGIPVMGHLGLMPQAVNQAGGYLVQGKTVSSAQRILEDAKLLQQAGAYAVVLECIPSQLAQQITEQLEIPTIGIGAGAPCDGQVLVCYDMLGIYNNMKPKFVKQYASLYDAISASVQAYKQEVQNGQFPAEEHSYQLADDVLSELYGGTKE